MSHQVVDSDISPINGGKKSWDMKGYHHLKRKKPWDISPRIIGISHDITIKSLINGDIMGYTGI